MVPLLLNDLRHWESVSGDLRVRDSQHSMKVKGVLWCFVVVVLLLQDLLWENVNRVCVAIACRSSSNTQASCTLPNIALHFVLLQ